MCIGESVFKSSLPVGYSLPLNAEYSLVSIGGLIQMT